MKDSEYQRMLQGLRIRAVNRLHKRVFGEDRPHAPVTQRPKRNRLGRQDARRK